MAVTKRTRANTRARLLAGAAEVIGEKGFQRASLDEIAARSGLTKGAVYSSFDSKEALFLAVVSEKALRMAPSLPPEGSLRDHLRALGEACADLLPQAKGLAAFISEFHLYALTHEAMRSRIEQAYADQFREGARMLADKLPIRALPLPPEVFPVVVQALSMGLVYQHCLTPQAVTREVVVAAFEALAGPA